MSNANQSTKRDRDSGPGVSPALVRVKVEMVNLITPPETQALSLPAQAVAASENTTVIDLITPPETQALSLPAQAVAAPENTTAIDLITPPETHEIDDQELRNFATTARRFLKSWLIIGKPIPRHPNLNEIGKGAYGIVMQVKLPGYSEFCIKIEVSSLGIVKSVKSKELEILPELKECPNIISVIPVTLESGLVVLAMPMFEMNLLEYMKGKGVADPKILKDLLQVIGYLLDKELGHGDFKPQNILLTKGPTGVIKVAVTDTGTVSSRREVQETGVCTPWYTGIPQIIKELQDLTKYDAKDDRLFEEVFEEEHYVGPDDLYSLMLIAIEVALQEPFIVPLPVNIYELELDHQYLVCTHIISKMFNPNGASNEVAGQLKLYMTQYTGGDDEFRRIVEGQLSKVDKMIGDAINLCMSHRMFENAQVLRKWHKMHPVTFNSHLADIGTAASSNFPSEDARTYYYKLVELILSGILSGTSSKEIMTKLEQL